MSHAHAPGSPKALPPASPLVSRALEGRGREVSVSKPSVRIRIVDRRHLSAQQPAPRILCSSPPSLFFPIAYSGSPHPGSSLLLFITGRLGKNACLLFSQTDPACRGQEGTTSFSKFAPSWSIESCFLLDRASMSPAVPGQPRPPSPRPLPRVSSLFHPRLSWGLGQSHVGDGLGQVSVAPQMAPPA